jgi:hypothetical protein
VRNKFLDKVNLSKQKHKMANNLNSSSQDRKELDKYVKFLIFKSAQIIVQVGVELPGFDI